MTRHRSEANEHAINALIAKRQELMEEIGSTRERLAVLSNDVEALDRVLENFGYAGEIKLTPRVPRVVLFYRNELRQFCLGQLREHGERTSRQIAESLIQMEGKDARDRRMMVDVTRRVSKALRMMLNDRLVRRADEKTAGEYVWRSQDRNL